MFGSNVLKSHCKHWVSESRIIFDGENTGLGSYEALVTTFSLTNQYRTLFYMGFY